MSGPRRLRLGIDCATSHLALALVDQEVGTVAAYSEDVGRAHASMAVGAVEALLAAAGASRRDVELIGVGVGPGSYTGVRVALATARGLARALGVGLGGVSSLVALAGGHVEPGAEAVAVIDAGRGNVYAQHLRRRATEPWALLYDELGAPIKLSRASLADAFPGVPQVEGVAPDAGAIAWAAVAGLGLEPHYL